MERGMSDVDIAEAVKHALAQFPQARGLSNHMGSRSTADPRVMRAVRDVMVFSPPLTISRDEIEELARRARRAIDLTAEAVGRA